MKKGDLVRFKQPENYSLFLCWTDRIRFVRDHPTLKSFVELDNSVVKQWVLKADIEPFVEPVEEK